MPDTLTSSIGHNGFLAGCIRCGLPLRRRRHLPSHSGSCNLHGRRLSQGRCVSQPELSLCRGPRRLREYVTPKYHLPRPFPDDARTVFSEMVHHIESGLIYLACARMSSRLLWLPPGGNFNASGISLGDGHVATYDISTGKVTRLRMKDYPGHLAPHGMDVVPSAEDPTKLYVYVVNHRAPNVGDPKVVGGNSVVDVFETKVGTGVLKYLRTVEDTIIHTPNDVLGFPDGKSFYVTNDHAFKLGLVSSIVIQNWARLIVLSCVSLAAQKA